MVGYWPISFPTRGRACQRPRRAISTWSCQVQCRYQSRLLAGVLLVHILQASGSTAPGLTDA